MRTSHKSAALAVCIGVAISAGAQPGEAITPECRGVAAGTVAAMRAAGELPSEEATAAAIVAARRACSAALQDLAPGGSAAAAGTQQAAAGEPPSESDDDERSIWDVLTRDRELKPGNERLRRLKTQ